MVRAGHRGRLPWRRPSVWGIRLRLRLRLRSALWMLFAVAVFALYATTPVAAKVAMSQPSVSADGGQIAFVANGGIWTVASGGGKARLLVPDDGGNDSRPLYSTAGKQLAFKLIDGGTVRLPFITITDNHGQPMESHPHPVDIPVSRPLGESFQHEDSDLDAAVRGLSSTTSGTATG